MDNPDALANFHVLLLALTRLVTSVVISRGPQNQQSILQARTFLVESRPLIVAMFKRSVKIGQRNANTTEDATDMMVEELVELFVLLLSYSNFMEYEEEQDTQRAGKIGFS